MPEQPGRRTADDEPRTGDYAQPPAEHRGGAVAGHQQQKPAGDCDRARQHLEPTARVGPRPCLIRGESEVEVRSDERDECTPNAQQNQEETAHCASAALHPKAAAAGTNSRISHGRGNTRLA